MFSTTTTTVLILCIFAVTNVEIMQAYPMDPPDWNAGGPAVDTSSPLAVLHAQLDDMQKGSVVVAYQLASPANRANTAPPDGYGFAVFDAMVRGYNYKPLVSGYGYKVEKKGNIDGKANEYFANVRVYKTADKQNSIVYEFTMSIQNSNVVDEHVSLGPYQLPPGHPPVWRTNSVLII